MHGDISPLPNTPSWCGAQLKKAQVQLYLIAIVSGVCGGNGMVKEGSKLGLALFPLIRALGRASLGMERLDLL
jgi:hypothetical protein